MKIGVFGGTFDPVHKGHIAFAKTALSELALDLLYVIPNGNPPHKTDKTDKIHRYEMAKIGFSGLEKVVVSDYEIQKETYSYTFETLRYLREMHPRDDLYFLMGMDNLTQFANWRNPNVICKLAKLVFLGRTHYETDADALGYLKETFGADITLLPFDQDISSTQVRQEMGQGTYLFDKIAMEVYQYILKKGLYHSLAVEEFDCYEEQLKHYIEEKRFRHSLGVACMAYRMALCYNEDCKLAYFAGLLHDIAKRMPLEKQLKLCKKIKLHPDEVAYPKMLHAPAGAGFVKKEYGIKDQKLLDAIRYHTMGHAQMTLFDKLIYMADYIEPCRDFEGVDELRAITFQNIDQAIIAGIDTTILSLVEEHLKISPVLLDVRNALLEQQQKGC